jgi:hypothetical protein
MFLPTLNQIESKAIRSDSPDLSTAFRLLVLQVENVDRNPIADWFARENSFSLRRTCFSCLYIGFFSYRVETEGSTRGMVPSTNVSPVSSALAWSEYKRANCAKACGH